MPPDDEMRRAIQAAIDNYVADCWRLFRNRLREVGAFPVPEADDDQGRGTLKTVDDFLALARAIPYRPIDPAVAGAEFKRLMRKIVRLQKPWYRRWYEDIFPRKRLPPPKDHAERLARLQERVRNFGRV